MHFDRTGWKGKKKRNSKQFKSDEEKDERRERWVLVSNAWQQRERMANRTGSFKKKKEKTAVQGLIWIVLYSVYKGSNKSNCSLSSSAPAKKKQLEIHRLRYNMHNGALFFYDSFYLL